MPEGNKRRWVRWLCLIVAILVVALIVWLIVSRQRSSASIAQNQPTPTITNTVTLSPTPTPLQELKWPENQQLITTILMYHHIGPLPTDADEMRRGLTVSAENFENQLKYLKENNYQVMTLKKMYELVALGKLAEKTVVLTFDDGYDDNYKYALPLLKKYDFNATFNILTGSIGKAEYMSDNQLKELVAAGNELGGHSLTHPDLSKLESERLKEEVSESKKTLEQISGQPVISFCYPAGKFSEEVVEAIRSAGYKLAVITNSGNQFSTDKPFELPRYRINPDTDIKKYLP